MMEIIIGANMDFERKSQSAISKSLSMGFSLLDEMQGMCVRGA